MPPRSKVLSLPKDLQEALNARLVAEGFRNYEDLSDWLNNELATRGMELRISHAAIHRHGVKFEERLDRLRMATDQAKAISAGAGDDEGMVGDALVRLVQERLFTLLMDMGDIDPENVNVSGLLKGIADITKASVSQKKWMQEVREKARQAAKEITNIAKKGGLSEETIRQIEQQVLGIPR